MWSSLPATELHRADKVCISHPQIPDFDSIGCPERAACNIGARSAYPTLA
jgi:hypothetical protein